jgi:uncharacterized protein
MMKMKRRVAFKLIVFATLISASALAQPAKSGANAGSRPPVGPSFNCSGARTLSEKTICNSRDLSLQDRQMASLYGQLRRLVADSPNHSRFVQSDQRAFINNRNRCDRRPAVITACLQVSYENRVMRLEELISEIQSRP